MGLRQKRPTESSTPEHTFDTRESVLKQADTTMTDCADTHMRSIYLELAQTLDYSEMTMSAIRHLPA